MSCICLRYGFSLSKICDASMRQFHTYPKLHSKAINGRIWKRRQIPNALVRLHTLWAIVGIIWGTYICFTKLIKPPNRWLIKERMISSSVLTVLSCNHQRTWKSYTPHRDQEKGWIKMPTYLNYGRILCYRHGTYEIYST